MAKTYEGSPILCMRLSGWQISGLKKLAREQGITVSDILREYVAAYLARNGITERGMQEIEGQMKLDV